MVCCSPYLIRWCFPVLSAAVLTCIRWCLYGLLQSLPVSGGVCLYGLLQSLLVLGGVCMVCCSTYLYQVVSAGGHNAVQRSAAVWILVVVQAGFEPGAIKFVAPQHELGARPYLTPENKNGFG